MSVPFRSILLQVIPAEHQWKFVLFEKWDSIIGPLANRVKIEKITEDTVFLSVVHPSWAQELFLLSNMLKKKINYALNGDKIKNIRFKTAAFNFKEKTQLVTTYSPLFPQFSTKSPRPPAKLNKREQGVLEVVGCDGLRSALEIFYAQCKARTEQGEQNEKNKTLSSVDVVVPVSYSKKPGIITGS